MVACFCALNKLFAESLRVDRCYFVIVSVLLFLKKYPIVYLHSFCGSLQKKVQFTMKAKNKQRKVSAYIIIFSLSLSYFQLTIVNVSTSFFTQMKIPVKKNIKLRILHSHSLVIADHKIFNGKIPVKCLNIGPVFSLLSFHLIFIEMWEGI